jgi:hypothetical protein
MESLFKEVLVLCAVAGLVRLGKVSLDSTCMGADASLAANRTVKALEDEIRRMLSAAAERDAEEDIKYGADRRGDEQPEWTRDHEDRLGRLLAAKARLDAEREAAVREQQETMERRKRKEEATGHKSPGNRPKTVEQVKEEQLARKANPTAPDSRAMKTRRGHTQGFKAQVVCTDDQIILATEVTNDANDKGKLHPMMQKAQAAATAVLGGGRDRIRLCRADAGYCSEADLTRECSFEIFMATKQEWTRRMELKSAPPPRGRIPKGWSVTQLMARKLRTKRGREEYGRRSRTVEPIFGQIKHVLGFDRFYGRDLETVRAEWSLICCTHNLRKLIRHMRAAGK